MTLFAGIDLGTSGVKTVLAEDSWPNAVERPRLGWSEQHPYLWWQATCPEIDMLAAATPT